MLVPGTRDVSFFMVGGLDPVPLSISVLPDSPSIVESFVFIGPSSEYDHHSSGSSTLAVGSRVIDSGGGSLSLALQLVPAERLLLDIQTPRVILVGTSGNSSEHDHIWRGKGDRVSIPTGWPISNNVNFKPMGLLFLVYEEVEFGRGKSSGWSQISVYLQ